MWPGNHCGPPSMLPAEQRVPELSFEDPHPVKQALALGVPRTSPHPGMHPSQPSLNPPVWPPLAHRHRPPAPLSLSSLKAVPDVTEPRCHPLLQQDPWGHHSNRLQQEREKSVPPPWPHIHSETASHRSRPPYS